MTNITAITDIIIYDKILQKEKFLEYLVIKIFLPYIV